MKNHSLVDGNKRLALTALAVFLSLNNYLFYAPRGEAVTFTLRVASSEGDLHWKEISKWVRRHSISFDRFLAMSDREIAEQLGMIVGMVHFSTTLVEHLRDQARE